MKTIKRVIAAMFIGGTLISAVPVMSANQQDCSQCQVIPLGVGPLFWYCCPDQCTGPWAS